MIKGSDFFNSWFDDLKCGTIIEPWDCGLSTIEIEARKVIGISGQPGVGKSAFCSQICFDALENNPDIKVLFCNVEMPMQDIFNREMARQSKVPLWMIRKRKFRESEDNTRKVEVAAGRMKSYLERVYFVESPFTFSSITALGLHSLTNLNASGNRSRSSIFPSCLPATEKGGQGTPPANRSIFECKHG